MYSRYRCICCDLMVIKRTCILLTSVRRLRVHVPTEKHTFCPPQGQCCQNRLSDEVMGRERLWLREVSEAVIGRIL